MDSFSSQSGAPSEEEVMEKLRAHFAQAYAQEILEAVGDKCFTVCVTKPETSFSRSEGNCVSNCMERYIEATRIISRAVLNSQP